MMLAAELIVSVSATLSPEPPVPVTAKLSKRFYDVLGEDVANELVEWFNAVDLTYRTDLRELNELNYSRFEAKVEQRLAEFGAALRQEIAELRAELRLEFRTELRAEIGTLRGELRAELQSGLQEVRTELQDVRTELREVRTELRDVGARVQDGRTNLERVRTELLRWMFGFWVTTLIGIAGLLIALRAN
jgi:hypothetical protein